MRRIIILALVGLSLSTTPALAQRFRGIATHQPILRPGFFPFPFLGPNVSFVSMLPTTGHFVQATQGNLVLSTRSFVPSATGNSVLRAEGVFTPVKGTFVPALNGNFLLTTREAFNPKTGTFVASATGNFVFSTRGDLIASSTGMAVGSFLPFVPFVPIVSHVPVAVTTPNGVNPYLANPYAANPYSAGLSNPYIVSYPIYAASPNSGTNSSAQANMKAAPDTAALVEASQQTALGSYGIPSENGHIKWPLAFRLLPPEKKQNLVDRLEQELVQATTGASNGTFDPSVFSEAKKNVARLHGWLTAHRTDMAEATYRDGLDFLRTLDEALIR